MCCTTGRPATGSSPFGTPRESGRSRVASPATGTTAVVMATGDGRLVRASSARVVRAASWVLRGAYCRIEGKEGGGGRALAAPRARAVPGRRAAEFLRIRAPFATVAGPRGRTSVFPRLDGVGPTFDARVSKAVAKHARLHPKAHTPEDDDARPEPRPPPFPSVMLFAPAASALAARPPRPAADARRAPRRSALAPGPSVRQPSRARPRAATRMTQIGQNEPLAPAAAQMPTHSSETIAAAPAR